MYVAIEEIQIYYQLRKRKSTTKNKSTRMYYLLTESFKEKHKELVKIILEAVLADKIYLLGSTLMIRRTKTVFMTDAPSCRYVGHYYVLVLVRNKTNCRAVQDKIENSSKHFIPVTAIVLYTKQFSEWLTEG